MNLTYRLGWTLLHFLWQGAAIALLLAAMNAALKNATARARYAAACGAMLLMLACAGATFIWLGPASAGMDVPVRAALAPALSSAANATMTAPAMARLSGYLEWLVYFWLAGVCALTVRSMGGWLTLQRFKRRGTRPAEAGWQERMARLAERLQIARTVRLCESVFAEVPAVIGWVRPMVLLPASALTGLTTEQLEGLLAHELAHIRRHDYLVNLLQTGIETLLFYHPAVWWVGKKMRTERENCCDDLAVRVCGDAVAYARALAQLEQLRSGALRLAMAANGGSLLARIQRLIPLRRPARAVSSDWVTGAALVLIVIAGWAAPRMPQPAASPVSDASRVLVPQTPARLIADSRPVRIIAAAMQAEEANVAQTRPAEPEGQDFLDGLEKAGYRNLTVDQLIELKIHGVDAEYIRQIQAAGYRPTIAELVSLRIHGVEAASIGEMRTLGYRLDLEQVVEMQIHGLTPELARKMKGLGFGDPSFDQLIALQIHGVDPDFANGLKQAGLRGLNFDKLIELKIHGADPAQIREVQSLGFKDLSTSDVISLCIHGVTPEFIRDARKHGFKDLSLEQIIKLKQFGILDTKESN